MDLLPRCEEAVIPLEKFTRYALDPERDTNKAIAFSLALGYKLEHADMLIASIRDSLPVCNAVPKGDLGHGMRYEVVMKLTGINGKTARVITGWIDDKNTGEMRLINAYVAKKTRRLRND